MVAFLAGAAFVAAAILAATRTARLARTLTVAGLAMTVVAVGLAVSAEFHFRSCESRNEQRWNAWWKAHPDADPAYGVPIGAIHRESCERWPW